MTVYGQRGRFEMVDSSNCDLEADLVDAFWFLAGHSNFVNQGIVH